MGTWNSYGSKLKVQFQGLFLNSISLTLAISVSFAVIISTFECSVRIDMLLGEVK